MVPYQTGRHSAVRGESAEEISGHRSFGFRDRSVAGTVGRIETRHGLLDRARGSDFPCGQSAHEALRILGMAHRRGESYAPGRHFPLGSLHAAEGDVSPGKIGLHPVLQLFPMAEYQVGTDPVFYRPTADGGTGISTPGPLAQYTGYCDGTAAAGRTSNVHVSVGVGGNTRSQLWDLRSRVRTRGTSPLCAGRSE